MSLNRARTEQPTSEVAASAMLVGQAHLGAGALLAQGVVLRSRRGSVRLSNHSAGLENTDGTVLVGRPPRVLRTATDADRVRLADPRGGQINLTHHPGTAAVPPTLHHRTPR